MELFIAGVAGTSLANTKQISRVGERKWDIQDHECVRYLLIT
jgi:hypothetical protein